MAKLRINGDSSGYVDLEAPNAASSSTLDLDQVPQKNVANTFSANNTFSSNSYFGSEGVRLSTDGSGELGVGYGQTATTKRFSVYDGTSNRFSISPEGYVLTPSQPSFMAVGSSATPSSQSYWPWGSIIHNNGSHFSLATGRFTAPVAGKYMLFATFIGANVDEVYRYYTRKNGSVYPTSAAQIRLDNTATGSNYGYGTSAIIMDMAAGDYASIWFESGGTASHPSGANTTSGHEIFSGYLIG